MVLYIEASRLICFSDFLISTHLPSVQPFPFPSHDLLDAYRSSSIVVSHNFLKHALNSVTGVQRGILHVAAGPLGVQL
jgi:hypothetical protein